MSQNAPVKTVIKKVELTYKVCEAKETYEYITSPCDAVKFAFPYYEKLPFERISIIGLGNRNDIYIYIISDGNPSCSYVFKEQALKFLLVANCSSAILLHNHPSGILEASVDDILLARSLYDGCKCIGLKLLDAIIIVPSGESLDFISYFKEVRDRKKK